MKKTMICFALLAVAVSAWAEDNKPYTKEGKTFVATPKDNATPFKGDQVTSYLWQDSKGNQYPIILHTYTKGEKAGKVTAYVIRTSAKTGKEYRYFLPEGEAIAKEIINENE